MWPARQFTLIAAVGISWFQNSISAWGTQNSPGMDSGYSSSIVASGQSSDSTSPVSKTTPVITVRGLCGRGKNSPAGTNVCVRQVTREQFEILVNALSPDGRAVSAAARRNLAKTYADYLAVEEAARHAEIEDSAEFRALLEWTRLRVITDSYRHHIEEKYRTASPAEIEAYYHQNITNYERAHLTRILVPREGTSVAHKNEGKDKFDKKAMEAAAAARARAARGEDASRIQNDVYSALGLASPPPVDLGNRRRADMLPEEATEVFALKVGEISQLETELRNYAIYKVVSKEVIPLEEAKTDIAREIYQQKFKAAMKSVLEAAPAEFNDEYFGPGSSETSPKLPFPPPSSPKH